MPARCFFPRPEYISLLLLILHLSFAPAFAFSVDSQGKIEGTAQCNKIGSLLSQDLQALINGSQISIQESDGSGKKRTVLSGVIFKSKVERDKITGRCFFAQGEKLKELLGKNAETMDLIETGSGESILCIIESIDQEKVIFRSKGSQNQISHSEISSINSARIFEFSADLKSADHLVFKPVFDRSLVNKAEKQKDRVASSKAASNESISDRALYFASSVLMIAAASGIAIPLAVAIPVSRYHKKIRNRQNSQLALLMFQRFSQPPPLRVNNNNNNINNNN